MLAGLTLLAALGEPRAAAAQGIQINVELRSLEAGGLDDGIGDRVVESYGRLTVGSMAVRWNNHTCEPRFGSGCLITTPPPYTTDIASGRHNWADMFLRFDARGFRTVNNVIFFTRSGAAQIAQRLTVSFTLIDHDGGSPDDVWCQVTNFELVAAGRTAEQWVTSPVSRSVRASGPDGFCTIGFRVSAQRLSTSP